MSFVTILQQLGASDTTPAPRELRTLSGLERGDRREFWDAWQQIQPLRRSEIAHAMVELSEDDVEFVFGEVWFWLLEDPDPSVRSSAVEGLWEDTSSRVLRQMVTMLRSDRDETVRAAVAMALSRFAHQAVLGELDEEGLLREALTAVVLNEQEPQEVRRRALESAGYFADSAPIQRQIARDYDSDEQLLRESALLAMGRSMLERWLPNIGRELASPSPALRYEAARAAGEMAEEAQPLLPRLLPMVNDPDAEVAITVIWALGQIGGEQARAALQRLRKSEDTVRSQAAEDALAELMLDQGIV